MLSSHAVAVTFGQRIHPFVAYLMTLSVCLSLIGSLNLCFLAVARLPFIAGRLGHMPEVSFRKLHICILNAIYSLFEGFFRVENFLVVYIYIRIVNLSCLVSNIAVVSFSGNLGFSGNCRSLVGVYQKCPAVTHPSRTTTRQVPVRLLASDLVNR